MKDIEAISYIKNGYFTNEFYSNKIESIVDEKVSISTLKNLLNTCKSTKHMEERINWYNDEENLSKNNWCDIEGEGYGWKWLRYEDEEDKWHGLLVNSLLDYINEKEILIKEKEQYVIIVYTSNEIIYHFIERDHSMCDRIYTFSNNEICY